MIRSLLACLLLAATAATVRAQTRDAAARAEALNAEGKAKIQVVDFEGAASRFRAAIALVPDPRFYFNLCYTLDRAGKLREARSACEVAAAGKDARLAEKARGRLVVIERAIADGKDGQRRTDPAPARPGDTLADGESAAPGTPIAVSPSPPGDASATGTPTVDAAAPQVRPGSTFAILFGLGASLLAIDPDLPEPLSVDPNTAVALGGGMNLWFGKLALQFEGLLARRGATVTFNDGSAAFLSNSFTYLDVVGAARFEPGQGRLRPYGLGGLYLGLKLAADFERFDGTMTTTGELQEVGPDLGLLVGGGGVFGGFRRAFSVDVRYQHGFTDADGTDATVTTKHRTLIIMAGYQL
jgi:hypothetical protein